MEIKFTAWENDEYIIIINKTIVGGTVHKKDAIIITNWLRSGYKDMATAISRDHDRDR